MLEEKWRGKGGGVMGGRKESLREGAVKEVEKWGRGV